MLRHYYLVPKVIFYRLRLRLVWSTIAKKISLMINEHPSRRSLPIEIFPITSRTFDFRFVAAKLALRPRDSFELLQRVSRHLEMKFQAAVEL